MTLLVIARVVENNVTGIMFRFDLLSLLSTRLTVSDGKCQRFLRIGY